MTSLNKLPPEAHCAEDIEESRFQPSDVDNTVLRIIREVDRGKTLHDVFAGFGKRPDDPEDFQSLVRASLIAQVRGALQRSGFVRSIDPSLKIKNPQHVFSELMQVPNITGDTSKSAEGMTAESFKSIVHVIRCNIEDKITMRIMANSRIKRF